jgi:hypothetical protein
VSRRVYRAGVWWNTPVDFFFLVVKGPAAGCSHEASCAMKMMTIIFCPFPSNGAPME